MSATILPSARTQAQDQDRTETALKESFDEKHQVDEMSPGQSSHTHSQPTLPSYDLARFSVTTAMNHPNALPMTAAMDTPKVNENQKFLPPSSRSSFGPHTGAIQSPFKGAIKRKATQENVKRETAGPVWMAHRPLYSCLGSVSEMLSAELWDFVDYIGPSQAEHQIRLYVFRRIQDTIKSAWPDATLELFGSFETMLYLPSSDLDMVITEKSFSKDFRTTMYNLASLLKARGVAIETRVISQAKVPIVKFLDSLTRIPIDISFNQPIGVKSAQLVNAMIQDMPVLRPMVLILKYFLLLNNLNEVFTGGIGSYTTMIMILSFLQMHPLVQTGEILPHENLGVMLVEFFELYGSNFNYETVGISVNGGGRYFEKEAFIAQNMKSTAVGKSPNRNKGSNTHSQYYMRQDTLYICSLDPVDSNNDTGRPSFNMEHVRQCFHSAFLHLSQLLEIRHNDLLKLNSMLISRGIRSKKSLGSVHQRSGSKPSSLESRQALSTLIMNNHAEQGSTLLIRNKARLAKVKDKRGIVYDLANEDADDGDREDNDNGNDDSDDDDNGDITTTETSLIEKLVPISHSMLEHRRLVADVFYRGEFQKMFADPEPDLATRPLEEQKRMNLDKLRFSERNRVEKERRVLNEQDLETGNVQSHELSSHGDSGRGTFENGADYIMFEEDD